MLLRSEANKGCLLKLIVLRRAQFNRPAQLPILIHPMLYNTDADQLFGEYYDHGRRAIWLGRQVRSSYEFQSMV